MPIDCCYFVDKAAAAGAAPALNNFGSILHCSAVFTQNLGQTRKDATTSSLCIRSYSYSAIRTTSQLYLLRAYHNSSRKSRSRLFCDLTVHFFSGRNARFYARQLFAEGLKLLTNRRAVILRVLPARRRAAAGIVRGAFRPRLFF